MRYVARFDVPISVAVDVKQAGWAANPAQYGYDNNRSYMNLRGARWRDVDRMIAVEQKLIRPCLIDARDESEFNQLWERASKSFESPYDLEGFRDPSEAAYALDFGTAAATLALNAAGCPTIMACSGHQTGYPYIAFWLPIAKLTLLEEASREAGVGFGNGINGAAEVYSDSPDGLLRFALQMRHRSAPLGRIRSTGWPRYAPDEGEDSHQLSLPLI